LIRFWLVARTGVSASCLTFNSVRKRELLIGLSDHTIHCYDIDTCQLVAKLPAFHQSGPTQISVHPTKPLAISSGFTEAVLWDTESWERKRLLEGGDHQGLQQATFSPDGMMLCASFVDGSVYFWTLEFSLLWKISLAQLAVPDSELSLTMCNNLSIERFSYFALSDNGEYFAYIGLSSCVYIWNLFEKRLVHEILIPSFEGKMIAQAQFLSITNVLALLSNAGEIIFIDASSASFVSQLKGKHQFHRFSVSPDGRFLAVITKDSKCKVSLLRLDQLFESNESEKKEFVEENEKSQVELQPIIPKVVAQPPKTFFELIESKQESSFFNRAKIRGFLHHYGSYPDQFRPLIWRYLLKLPENRASYEALLEQGTHPSFRDFRLKFPLKSDRAAKSMERILSCLAFWSPIFEDLDYLPSLVFPFVKLFWNDLFSCLEVVITILMNWCQKWWEYYPNPPIELLDMTSQLLSFHDPELYSHFVKCNVTAQVYGWTLMQSLFSELFSKKDWLMVWDHLVSNSPSFFYHFMVSYLIHFRRPLLRISELKDFYFFFQRRNTTNVTNIILNAYNIKSKTPSSLDPSSFLKPFEPSTKGEYPIFNKYPQFIVNYQSRMKDKIRQEEVEYIKKR
jgi:WD40 repeat protein